MNMISFTKIIRSQRNTYYNRMISFEIPITITVYLKISFFIDLWHRRSV